LKATSIELGLLLNFGRGPEIKSFLDDNTRKNISLPARRAYRPEGIISVYPWLSRYNKDRQNGI